MDPMMCPSYDADDAVIVFQRLLKYQRKKGFIIRVCIWPYANKLLLFVELNQGTAGDHTLV